MQMHERHSMYRGQRINSLGVVASSCFLPCLRHVLFVVLWMPTQASELLGILPSPLPVTLRMLSLQMYTVLCLLSHSFFMPGWQALYSLRCVLRPRARLLKVHETKFFFWFILSNLFHTIYFDNILSPLLTWPRSFPTSLPTCSFPFSQKTPTSENKNQNKQPQ